MSNPSESNATCHLSSGFWWNNRSALQEEVSQEFCCSSDSSCPEAQPEKPARAEDVHFASLEEDLGRHFGTKVKIRRHGKKGRVELEFYDDRDLDRLLSLLKS